MVLTIRPECVASSFTGVRSLKDSSADDKTIVGIIRLLNYTVFSNFHRK